MMSISKHVHTNDTSETHVHRTVKCEHEPVAWMWDIYCGAGYFSRGIGFEQTSIPFAKHTPLYTAPPQRKPLSDEQVEAISEASVTNCYFDTVTFARAIEAAHGIGGNHG